MQYAGFYIILNLALFYLKLQDHFLRTAFSQINWLLVNFDVLKINFVDFVPESLHKNK